MTMTHDQDLLLKTALPILQGLLASGHFTHEDRGNDPAAIRSFYEDEGKQRYYIAAVGEAMFIANNLLKELVKE